MFDNIFSMLIRNLFPWILAAFAISVFRYVFWPKIKGRLGETLVNSRIRNQLDPTVYHLIPDVMLPTSDGTTQIDHVIVSRYGIFVLETKTFKGWIYGNERDPQWTQVNYRRKDRFQNPLRQNFKHMKTLAGLTGIPEEYFKSVVVFAGDCTFKTEMPVGVVYVRDFIKHITGFNRPIIRELQVPEIVSAIGEWASTLTSKQKAGHVAHVQQKKASVSSGAQPPACPKCGSTMTLRTSRKDGNQFWGCLAYPKCRGTRSAA